MIAIVACLGLAVDLASKDCTVKELDGMKDDTESVLAFFKKKTDYLRTSRPTAVNLFNALDELEEIVNKAAASTSDDKDAKTRVVKAVIEHAEFMLQRDVSDNQAIGDHGADELLSKLDDESKARGLRMVTICNTGSLATAGFGTALGVARALHKRGQLKSITALETRPYNQGSRLTAFEIVEENMPGEHQLICDSSAAALMRTKGVDACVVGADRVCANGDTANKIGTYNLSVVAAAHNVSFYVASPFTTLDKNLANGDMIEIEERPAAEMLESSRAPKNVAVWNPAFDVTPAKCITGIITEKGVIHKEEDGTFNIPAFIEAHSK